MTVIPSSMRAIRKITTSQGFEITEIEVPEVGAEDVLIKVSHAGICGTDLHIVGWDAWSASRIKPPMTFGHEFCGNIAAVGTGVKGFNVGDYVTAEMHLPCGECHACLKETPHICENLIIAGVDRNGSYADYIVLPAVQVIKLPSGIAPEVAACMDAIGNAVHAATKTDLKDKVVLITGCGPIGLFAVATAKALGAKAILASDVQPFRLEMAQKLGANTVYNVAEVDLKEAVNADYAHTGIDVVLEMSGQQSAITAGLELLNPAGHLVCLGIPAKPIALDWAKHLLFREITVVGVTGRAMFETWDRMIELLTSGKLDVTPVITHQFNFTDFGQAIEQMQGGLTGKVILTL